MRALTKSDLSWAVKNYIKIDNFQDSSKIHHHIEFCFKSFLFEFVYRPFTYKSTGRIDLHPVRKVKELQYGTHSLSVG